MWHRTLACVVFMGGSLISLPVRATAQADASPVLDSAKDSTIIKAAAEKADTGRTSPPYRDLSRYDTPGYCLAAVQGAENITWRKHERDTLEPTSPTDTLPSFALTVGRICAEKFSVDKVPGAELPAFLTLSILIGDTTRARMIVDRQLALAKTVEQRGFVLFDAFNAFMDARPTQRVAAQAMLVRLDSLGLEARVPRLLAHKMVHEDSWSTKFDTAIMLREGKSIESLVTQLTPEELIRSGGDPLARAFDSITLAWIQRKPDLQEAVAGILEREYAKRPWIPEIAKGYTAAWMGREAEAVGTDAPRVKGIFWFPDSTTQPQPAPGKVTLLWQTRKGGGFMSNMMAMLRRMHDRYASQGLDIVLVVGTEGYSWSSPPQTAEQEAQTIAWYFQDYLKLPFTIAVEDVPKQKLFDGRLFPGRLQFRTDYETGRALIGHNGKIYTRWIGVQSESQLDTFIRMALKEEAGSERAAK